MGTVKLSPLPSAKSGSQSPLIAVHVRTTRLQSNGGVHPHITVTPASAARVLEWHAANETIVFQPQGDAGVDFNFTSVFP